MESISNAQSLAILVMSMLYSICLCGKRDECNGGNLKPKTTIRTETKLILLQELYNVHCIFFFSLALSLALALSLYYYSLLLFTAFLCSILLRQHIQAASTAAPSYYYYCYLFYVFLLLANQRKAKEQLIVFHVIVL